MQKYDKEKVPKGVQKGDGISGVAALGAPWTPQSVFEHKKYAQSAPKMTSRVQKWPQNASKVTPKVAKCTLTGAPKWFKCIKKCQLQDTGVPLGKRGLIYFGGACALRFLNFNFWEPVRSRFQDLTSNFWMVFAFRAFPNLKKALRPQPILPN